MQISVLTNLLKLTKAPANASPGVPALGGIFSELEVSELMPQYYSLVKSGVCFMGTATAITPSAFVGGAAGTPIFGLYNPANSGIDIVILQALLGIRTTGTAAVATDFNFWTAAAGTVPTYTGVQPKNAYTHAAAGSSALYISNAANTGAPATTLERPSFSIGLTAATAVTNVQMLVDDVKGAIIVSPGSYLAYGQSVATTAGSFDAGLLWAEVPA